MSTDNQISAEKISAAIVSELAGYFNRTKDSLWVVGNPRDTLDQRKTEAAYKEIAEQSNVTPSDVKTLVSGQFVEENKCRAICEVLIPEPDKRLRKVIVQLMGMLANAPQQPAILAQKAAPISDPMPVTPKLNTMKAPPKIPQGWSPIEEVVKRYKGELKDIENIIRSVPKKAEKKFECLQSEEGQTLVSVKYEKWLLNHEKLTKEPKQASKQETTFSPSPATDAQLLTWRSVGDVTNNTPYDENRKPVYIGNKDKVKELLWGEDKNKPDKDSLFSKLVGDIAESLKCSRNEALEYAKNNLAGLQHFQGEQYVLKFSPDMLRNALQEEDKKGKPILRRTDKHTESGILDIPDKEIQSLKQERAAALERRKARSSEKE